MPDEASLQVSVPEGPPTTKLATGPDPLTVTRAVWDELFSVAVIVVVFVVAVGAAVTMKFAVDDPAATVTLAGIVTTPAGDEDSVTTDPPDGAA